MSPKGDSSLVLFLMAEDRQSEKLKERLQQWQSYAAQPAVTDSACSQEDQEANGLCLINREAGDVYPCALPEVVSLLHGNGASPIDSGERYKDQIAHLEAELERERAHAQEMAVKWGSEVQRRQREAQHQPPHPQPKVRMLAIENAKSSANSKSSNSKSSNSESANSKSSKKHADAAPKPQQAQKSVYNYLPILVICLSVFLAGLGSVIALNLVWSLGH